MKHLITRTACLSLAFTVSISATAQKPNAGVAAPAVDVAKDPRVIQALSLLETWASSEQAYRRLPAVSMAVVHDQQLLWSKGFGLAHVESKTPAGPATMYSVCSISKLFTSIAVMQQRDAGRVRLDDPVARHLSWFRPQQADGAPPVTVFGLLTHSSGLPREAEVPYWTGPAFAFPPREKLIESASAPAMLYRPEVHFQYSNLGLTLAGEVAASAAGRPWSELVRTGILDPLGLKDTQPEHQDRFRGNRLASGYTAPRRDGSREKVPPYQLRGIAPAAGFTSTVEDLGRFASWQLRLLGTGKTEVLSADTLREMQRVQWMENDWKTSWGLGFEIWRSGEKTFVGHGGYCPGYQSHLLLQTGDKVATVFMTNTNGVDAKAYAQKAYDIVASAIGKAGSDPGGAKRPDPALARYAGRYDNWTAGEIHVLPWEDGLALVTLPAVDPLKALVKLKPSGEHRFLRVRDDGDLGEEIRFEVDEAGVPVKLWRFANYATRVPAGS
jgi:CubicO group peptidase (beta-lactamase class C family)